MKKTAICTIVMLIISCLMFVGFAAAEDKMIEKKVNGITFKNDKNQNPYARVMTTEKATLNGVTYDKSISLVAFGDIAKELKGVKKGQTIKVIASEQEYRGTKSYNILKVVK